MKKSVKKECIAMLLAGGQGTRLGVLTKDVAKPAVPFAAKYRIIDFPLSNCINSGIDTVGVLTQYQPFELNQYIGNGQPWDLDRLNGGIFVLPPFMRAKSGEWYKGTANAIYQNIEFIDDYNPDYVLILSGDHIYKMDYAEMLAAHKKNRADCTIAVRDVPIEEASRFGIMNLKKNGEIYEFEEKPKQPKSNKASMGIYVFTWSVLRRYLVEDEANKESDNDFGKNIITKMIADGQRMFAYQFDGYWKDVGTISSLWEANMDVLRGGAGEEDLDLDDDSWKIYARNMAEPPQFISPTGRVQNCLISEGTVVHGTVKDSIVSHSATIGKNAYVEGSIIMPGATVEEGADVRYSIVGWDAVVGKGCMVGETLSECKPGEWKISVIAPGYELPDGTVVGANEMIG
ncbi:MAG TPA: glucose-1-phosphate adenylyltransferase [Candidatus Limadaptatus stercorigallinarum]|mgnify:FL=1|uniref:Glucose-1-phosphate adenylyltransferase n=1 Tax=Candidatus Limadaptatus stercorigallinarum TaxID=2840845 RepID=A0A9D1HTU3_9FIRM|nr:glucose-1-phosphate adenylyltransferase [Candidatus Limadaptatus stercorigallinarum]